MSDYDPSFVPTKSYFLVGQKAILLNKDKILILKRSVETGGAGLWSIPGGGLDSGENPLKSIKREIEEETNIKVSKIHPFITRVYSNKGDNVLIIGYLGKTSSNKIKLNWEHTDYKWVEKEEALKEKLTKDAQFFIEKFK